MLSKLFTSVFLVSTLALKVNAHAAILPMLGVTGTPSRNDVQRPSASAGCGSVNVASTIDKSTPVIANANGEFTVNATDFNAGQDGSRKVSATLDETGVGKTFSKTVNITQNGNPAPTSVGSEQVVAVLPPGTQCSGGTAKNLCLVSFKTTAGFGNCVVVKQDSTTNGSDNATTDSSSGTNSTQATSGSTTSSTNSSEGADSPDCDDSNSDSASAASSTISSQGAAPTGSDSPDCDHSSSDSAPNSNVAPTSVVNSSEATVTQTVTNIITVTATVSASAVPSATAQQSEGTAGQNIAAAAEPSSSIIQLTVGGTRSPRALRYVVKGL